MIELNLTDLFLDGMITYGSLVLGLALMLGALGLPLPGTLMVVAAGASAQQGLVDWSTAMGLGLLGAVLGDNLSYAMGRLANGWVRRRIEQSPAWQAAQVRFEQRGAWAVYLTRFLLTPLAIPTNLIAGGSGYGFGRFLAYDVAGELTWLLLYGGLGYTFGSRWAAISQLAGDYGSWLAGGVVAASAIYALVRRQWPNASSFKAPGHGQIAEILG